MNRYTFKFQVKTIEQRDSVLTSKQQIDRLLKPGSTYLNLNPFEVQLLFNQLKKEFLSYLNSQVLNESDFIVFIGSYDTSRLHS